MRLVLVALSQQKTLSDLTPATVQITLKHLTDFQKPIENIPLQKRVQKGPVNKRLDGAKWTKLLQNRLFWRPGGYLRCFSREYPM